MALDNLMKENVLLFLPMKWGCVCVCMNEMAGFLLSHDTDRALLLNTGPQF